MADGEIWAAVFGYEGLYEVSNLGRVRSLPHTVKHFCGLRESPGRILNPVVTGLGYFAVDLCKNGRRKKVLVHRLVADAFIPGKFDGAQVNHKDENKANNRYDNLEWCSAKYNNNYGTRNERVSAKNKVSKCKPVAQILNGEIIGVFPSTISAWHIADPGHIGHCCNGKRKTAGGYQWAFVIGEE